MCVCVCVCVCRLLLVTENNRFPLEFITTVRERTSTKKKKKRHFLQNNTREHMSCARTLTFSTASSSSQHGHHRQFRLACSGGNSRSSIRRTFSPRKAQKITSKRAATTAMASGTKDGTTYVMINGITGKMGHAIANSVIKREGFILVPHAFAVAIPAEKKLTFGDVVIDDFFNVEKEGKEKAVAKLKEIQSKYANKDGSKFIVVDFTVPDAIDGNIAMYVEAMVPFVCGTTGGNREKFTKDVFDAKLPAVIAPQMGKQVVALQAAIKQMAESFPDAFKGYSMRVVESHQASKVDTSGTAKALIQSFNELGVGFDVSNVELIRDVDTQRDVMHIPEEYLLGHAYHTYTLTSADNTVSFEFQHNVCGRTIYAEGTVDAVGFLSRNLERPDGKTLFDMIDVLREGGMVTDANTAK